MKNIFVAACLSSLLVAAPAWAEKHAGEGSGKPLTAQQQKMKDCNAEAKEKGLKGAERKTFMKDCLSTGGAAPAEAADARAAQREKMKTCNAQAKEQALKGDERKSFMKTCLSTN